MNGGGGSEGFDPRSVDPRVILQPAIDAMAAHIAVIEPDGTILIVNEAWRRFADENGLRTPDYAVGRSYFEGWREEDGQEGADPRTVRAGIEAVLHGPQDEYRAVYPCHSDDVRRWFHLRATPFVHGGVRRAVLVHADVSPLVATSEALRESEERFRHIADSVPSFIYMLAADGALEFINKPLREYHGLAPEQLAGEAIATPLHPDDIPAAIEAFATAFQDPRPISVEHRMRGADGRYRWFLNKAVPRFTPDGKYLGYIGCCIDVHERKLAEHALETSERRYRAIFESAAVALWEMDFSQAKALLEQVKSQQGIGDVRSHLHANPQLLQACAALLRTRGVNDAAVRLMEADSREHLIAHLGEVFLPETFRKFADELADLMEERGEYRQESPIRTLKGDTRHCVFTVALPPAAPVESVLAAAIDVTEQRKLEDALRASEALNRAVLGSLKELIAVLDADGRIIATNRAWEEYRHRLPPLPSGQPAVPGVGDNYLDAMSRAAAASAAAAAPAAECGAIVSGIQRVLAVASEVFETEYRCPVSAEEVWFLMTVAPLRGAGSGAVVALTDITARKEAQHLMQALNARLLRAQEDERRRLAREMHDDVTQRLAVLAIEAGRLEMQLTSAGAASGAAAAAAAAATIRHMTEQIVKLSSDVHAISRQLHPSILDDLGLADAVESECHAFTDREGIAVDLTVGPLPESLPGDVALCLYRILQEGLRNVAKHAQTDRASVAIAVEQERELVLRIADRGRGFDPSRARGGPPGLGLASMRERARLVGAGLTVRSAPGAGTTIEVRAPLPTHGAAHPPSSGEASS